MFMFLTSSLRSRLPGLPADGSRRPKCRYQLFDFLVYIPPPCALGFHPATYHAHACFPLRTLLCSLRYISCWLRCILYLLYPVYPLVYSCLSYTLVVLMKRVCDLANISLVCAILTVLTIQSGSGRVASSSAKVVTFSELHAQSSKFIFKWKAEDRMLAAK